MQRHLNFLDLPLPQIQVWEELDDELRNLLIEALARLIAKAAFPNPNQEPSHD